MKCPFCGGLLVPTEVDPGMWSMECPKCSEEPVHECGPDCKRHRGGILGET